MKKCIVIVCLMTIFSMNAMQNNEKSLVQKMRVSKDLFEKQLKIKCPCSLSCIHRYKDIEKMHLYCLNMVRVLTSFDTISDDQNAFLQYCYYQKLQDKGHVVSDMLEDYKYKNLVRLNRIAKNCMNGCYRAQINGYSAISAAMIAQHRSFEEKRNFIGILFKHDFKPSLQDIQLAELLLHDATIKNGHEEWFVYLLHLNSPAYWRELLPEVKKIIASYLFELIKKEEGYWLLPGY